MPEFSTEAFHALYPQVAQHITRTANQFLAKYGGDKDAVHSDAHWAFLQASMSYRQEKGASLKTWIRGKIWHLLLEQRRASARHYQFQLKDDEEYEIPDTRFDLKRFRAELSPEAGKVVEIVMRRGIAAKLENNKIKAKRSLLATILLDMGWAATEILDAFQEITESLS